MKTSLEQFAWAKPLHGYGWEDSTAATFSEDFREQDSDGDKRDREEGRFLLWRDALSPAESLTPFSENPTLYREFAHLDPTETSFQEFANAHGWLGVSCFLKGVSTDGGKTVVYNFENRRAQGEPLWRWRDAHRAMQRVVVVLDAIVSKDYAALRQWFTVSDKAVRYERTGPFGQEWGTVCAGQPPIKYWLWLWGNEAQDGDAKLVRFASGWAQKYINEAMGSSSGGTGTSVRVLLNDVKDGMMLHIVPDSLLAAMWLQCARVLTENPTFTACENCGKWFEVSPAARRKNSKYCSDRCKVAKFRRSRAQQ